jgi:hypothetical protein
MNDLYDDSISNWLWRLIYWQENRAFMEFGKKNSELVDTKCAIGDWHVRAKYFVTFR